MIRDTLTDIPIPSWSPLGREDYVERHRRLVDEREDDEVTVVCAPRPEILAQCRGRG